MAGFYHFMCQSGPAINWNITNPGAFNLQTNAISFNGNVNDIKLAGDQQTVGIGSRWFNTDAGFEKVSTRQIDVNRQLRYSPGALRVPPRPTAPITGTSRSLKNTRVAKGKSIQFRRKPNAFNHPLFPAPRPPYRGGFRAGQRFHPGQLRPAYPVRFEVPVLKWGWGLPSPQPCSDNIPQRHLHM